MVTKLFLLQCQIFGYDFVRLRKKIFTVLLSTLQIFLLAFLVSLEYLASCDEIVL